MAITASSITTSNTLEQLRTQFNNLVTDVGGLESGTLAYGALSATTTNTTTLNVQEDGTIVFEGATSDAFETTLTVTDPTADRTITLPNATGTVILGGNPSSADGEALGSTSLEWSDLYLADGGVIYFGDDQDVTLTHVADLGLTLDAGVNATTLTLNTTESGASVAPTLNLIRASGSPADADQLGYVNFVGHDSGANQVNYGQIYTTALDVTDGTEDGQLNFFTITAGSAVNALALSGGTAKFSDDVKLASDSAVLGFGADNDVTITHVADTGLNIKQVTDADDKALILTLQTGETDITVNDALGKIQFQAPDEASGTDAILVSAEIAAVSEGTFAAAANPTKLSFKTAVSEVASEKMSLSSAGDLTVSGDVILGDDVILDNDGGVVYFGDDQDVYLSHIADSGITFKNTSTGDDTAILLLMQTGETDIAADDILGRIQFQAPDEAAGTDAILVAAEIAAVSEGDFSASSNATKLSFKTGASEAASEKMSLSSGGNLSVSNDVKLTSDSSVLSFGADNEITLTHVADTGLNIKQVTDADDKAVIITLQTGETDIALNDYIGRIHFQAPDEAGGTDAIAVCAEISALAEGTFAADNNATSLIFATGASETATTKMKLSSTGVLTLSGGSGSIIIPDAGNIGSASATTAIAIAASGAVTLSSDITVGALLKMPTNTAGYLLVGDGTSYEEVAVSGDVTMASGGAVTIAANAVEGSMLNTDIISAQTALTSGLETTDELLVSDAGTLKRMDVSVLATLTDGNATALAIALG